MCCIGLGTENDLLDSQPIYVNIEKSRLMTCFLKSKKGLKKVKVVGFRY